MKIGYDGRFIRKRQTGNGVSSQLLLEGLARLDPVNEYTVYLLEDNQFIQKENFHLKQMASLHANSHLRFLLTFPLELYRRPVEIFHGFFTLPLRTTGRTVLSMAEFSWLINPEELPISRIIQAQLKVSSRYSVSRADRITTPTRYGRDQILEYFKLAEERVVVIPWGVNQRLLEACPAEEIERVKAKYGIVGEYLLTVGDLHPRKNLGRLIEAFDWLKEAKGIPHKLVLVGKNHQGAQEIYRKAARARARDCIVFTGYMPLHELRALYQGGAAFVFPSLNEGFGLPAHEAMASRLPVIVSDRGTLPEVVGQAALIVNPLDTEEIAWAIFRVLDSSALREELIARGLEQIRKYTWEESCRQILSLYQELSPR